ncbi:MAG: hypothetical protein ACOYU7_10100 [Bacillota bacterium]
MTQTGIGDPLVYIKQRWAAVVGLSLCLALLAGWCPDGECNKGSLLSLPWAGWGAAFYALCLLVPQSWITPVAAGGLLVHAYLARLMVTQHAFCVACLIAVVLTGVLFVKGSSLHSVRRVGLWGLAITLAAVGALLWSGPLFLSPSTSETPVRPVGSVPYQTASAEPVERSATPPAPEPMVAPIEVTTLDGMPVHLSPAERPVLLFASWCDHCLEPLKAVAQLPSECRPYLVAVFWEGEAQETEAKLRQAGLDGADYYTSPVHPESIPRLFTVTGEVKGESQVYAYLQQMR